MPCSFLLFSGGKKVWIGNEWVNQYVRYGKYIFNRDEPKMLKFHLKIIIQDSEAIFAGLEFT